MDLGFLGDSSVTYGMNGLPVRQYAIHDRNVPLMDLDLQRQNAFYGKPPQLVRHDAINRDQPKLERRNAFYGELPSLMVLDAADLADAYFL
mmetsp:Transcript_73/g.146  ORF Transcript_73/g.146 Transcript_73/m.146 type:complete len:91 (-) Transcript_73:61-333(-)